MIGAANATWLPHGAWISRDGAPIQTHPLGWYWVNLEKLQTEVNREILDLNVGGEIDRVKEVLAAFYERFGPRSEESTYDAVE